MPRQDVTKLLSSTLKEFATFKDEDVKEAIINVLEALDTDLEAIEYGQSDEVNDKMALLFAANGDARELSDEDEKEPAATRKIVKEEDDEDEVDDDKDDEDEDEDEVEEDDAE